MNKEKIGFTQGFVYAVAQLLRNDPTDAETLWQESGFAEKDLRFCDDYDAEEVRRMLNRGN